jgi:hypothetical protein
LHANQQAVARPQAEIEAEEQKAKWQALALISTAHKRKAERVQEWEDRVALERQHELLRGGAQAGARNFF